MSAAAECLFAKWAATPAVTAVFGAAPSDVRIWPVQAKDHSVLPLAVQHVLSSTRDHLMAQDSGLVQVSMQVSVYATDALSAKSSADLLRQAVSRQTWTTNGVEVLDVSVANEYDAFDPTPIPEQFLRILDLDVWLRET